MFHTLVMGADPRALEGHDPLNANTSYSKQYFEKLLIGKNSNANQIPPRSSYESAPAQLHLHILLCYFTLFYLKQEQVKLLYVRIDL